MIARALNKWPRIAEMVLAVWLGAAPYWVIRPDDPILLVHDMILSALIATCSAVAMALKHCQWFNLINVALGFWLVGFAYLFARGIDEVVAQNEILVGLAVAMIAIVPTRSLEPPAEWVAYYGRTGN